MATRIRLQRHGKKGRPYYKIVIADARAPRDGRYIELIGSYNPTSIPATIDVDADRALEWVMKGAQPSDTVRAILKYKGVYFKKHLQRGVEKGAMTEEQAEEKFQAWLASKEAKIAEAQTEAGKAKAAKIRASVEAGKEKAEAKLKAANEPPVVEAPEAEETPEAAVAEGETAVEAATETVAAEAEATAEEVVAEAKEDTPAADKEEEKA